MIMIILSAPAPPCPSPADYLALDAAAPSCAFLSSEFFFCFVLLHLMLMCILMDVSYNDTAANTEMKYKNMADSHF